MPMRPVLLALPVLALAACTAASAATRAYPVGGFDKVRNTTPANVRVHVGGAPSARADGPQEVLDRLTVEVRDGTLVVGMKPGSWFSGWSWRGTGRTVVEISVPMLAGAAVSGPGNVAVDHARAPSFVAAVSGPGDLSIGTLEARTASLALSGPGNIAVAGQAEAAHVTLSGPGDIRAKGLATRDATVVLSGPGDIDLAVSGTADVTLSGPGDVRIAGHPRCSVRKSGPGDVTCG